MWDHLSAAITAAHPTQLDFLSSKVWAAFSSQLISEDQAQHLAEQIQSRRTATQSHREGPGRPGRVFRSGSIFPPKRPPQRPADRQQSIERRRRLAASSPMPPALAARFTTGELAVLRIVADEVRQRGSCTRSIPEIAARSGVSETKARMALKIAADLGLLTIEERRVPYAPNLPNLVRIVSREWQTWIAKRSQSPLPRASGHLVRDEGVAGPSSATIPAEGALLGRPRKQTNKSI